MEEPRKTAFFDCLLPQLKKSRRDRKRPRLIRVREMKRYEKVQTDPSPRHTLNLFNSKRITNMAKTYAVQSWKISNSARVLLHDGNWKGGEGGWMVAYHCKNEVLSGLL